jgi:hypothetical protein
MRAFLHGSPSPKKASRRQEARVAKQTGGRRVPASGALPGLKGDVRIQRATREADGLLGELKYTTAASYRLTQADLRKITEEAVTAGKLPFFWVEFRRAMETPGEAYVVFPSWVVVDLLGDGADGAGIPHTTRRA